MLAERLKFNLLFALDERQDTRQRERAFFEVVTACAGASNGLERCVSLLLEPVNNPKLAMIVRLALIEQAIWRASWFRRQDLLDQCIRKEAFSAFPPEYRSSTTTVLEILKLGPDDPSQPEGASFHRLIQDPLDRLRFQVAGHVLSEMAVNGKAGLAEELVAKADAMTVAQSLDQSSAGVRLQWSRRIHLAAELAPLVQKLRTMLAQIPAAGAVPDERMRNRLRLGSWSDLTTAESTVLASLWLRSARVTGQEDLEVLLGSLVRAEYERIVPTDFGPTLFKEVIGLALDDAVKASILNSAISLCDFDDPAVRVRIDPWLQEFLASTEAATQPETTRVATTIRARIALRTSKDERPEALFGAMAADKIQARSLQLMQLRFHHSRGNWSECDSLVAALDPDAVKNPGILTIVRASLERTQRTSEIPLFVEAARGAARGDLAAMCFDPADLRASNLPRAFVETDGLEQLIPDNWYDRALAVCRDIRFNAELRYLRAKVRRDWAEALRACNDVLALSPTFYSYYLVRAEANRALSRNDEASKDLEIFLSYARDSVHYQEAVQMQKELRRESARGAAP